MRKLFKNIHIHCFEFDIHYLSMGPSLTAITGAINRLSGREGYSKVTCLAKHIHFDVNLLINVIVQVFLSNLVPQQAFLVTEKGLRKSNQ